MAWIGQLIGAGGGVAAASMQPDSTTATTSSTNTPAPWSDVGTGVDELFDEFMGTMTGGPEGNINNDMGYWVDREQALYQELLGSSKVRAKQLNDLNKNNEKSWRKASAYEEFKNTGDQQKLLSSLNGYVPHDELVKIINGDINIDEAISINKGLATQYQQEKEAQFPELKGMYSGTDKSGAAISKNPTLKEMMAEDTASQKDASTKYLEDMGVLTKDTTSGLDNLLGDYNAGMGEQMGRSTDATNNYSSSLDQISGDAKAPAFNILMGNKSIPVQTKRQLALAELLKGVESDKLSGTRDDINYQTSGLGSLYDTGASNLGAKLGLNSDQAGRELNVATEYTPNKADIDYFQNTLWPMIQSFQSNRFGSGTTTESATTPTSAAEKINTGLSVGTKLNDLFKSLNLGGKKEDKTSTDTTPIWA